MQARTGLAQALWKAGQREEAETGQSRTLLSPLFEVVVVRNPMFSSQPMFPYWNRFRSHGQLQKLEVCLTRK